MQSAAAMSLPTSVSFMWISNSRMRRILKPYRTMEFSLICDRSIVIYFHLLPSEQIFYSCYTQLRFRFFAWFSFLPIVGTIIACIDRRRQFHLLR